MKKKRGKWETLDGILEQTWAMLKSGMNQADDPFHWPVLGTITKEGSRLRTVILRGVDSAQRLIVCHTDARAQKVAELTAFANASWLFYHPERKVQLRISGRATLHSDDQFANEQWAETKITSRLNYCAVEPPGTIIDKPSSGLPDFLRNKVPTLLDSERGRQNFMVIACRIDSLDWVGLSTLGNRRARYVWDKNGLTADWLVP